MNVSKIRYHSLDSLRGIASLQVLISHSLVAIPLLLKLVYPPEKQLHNCLFYISHSPIAFLWSDSAAVKVFFVLSGFVLSLPYYNDDSRKPYYPNFFIKRIIRLYLPCLIIIFVSLLCQWLLYQPNQINQFGEWVKQMWTLPLRSTVMVNLLLLKDYLVYFDRALWTLPPEIKLSLILPAAIYILKPLKLWLTFLAVLLYVVTWHFLNKMGARDIWSDYPTLYYFTFFILGSVVCKYRGVITEWVNRLSKPLYILFVFVMLIIYTFKYTMFWLPAQLYHFLDVINDYVSAVAAVMILVLVLSNRAYALLNSKPLLFLGKISFSLYLVHIVVIASFAYLLHSYFSAEVVVGLAFLASFPIAILFYHFIEVPSLQIANRSSDAITKRYFIRNPAILK